MILLKHSMASPLMASMLLCIYRTLRPYDWCFSNQTNSIPETAPDTQLSLLSRSAPPPPLGHLLHRPCTWLPSLRSGGPARFRATAPSPRTPSPGRPCSNDSSRSLGCIPGPLSSAQSIAPGASSGSFLLNVSPHQVPCPSPPSRSSTSIGSIRTMAHPTRDPMSSALYRSRVQH